MTIRGLVCLLLMAGGLPVTAGECRPIDGLASLLEPGRVLLLGEMHGTRESPAFALDVACHALQAGLPVIFGFELMPVEQERVDRFLASEGTPADRQALLSGNLWQREYQDGRNSHAMLDLIDGLRRLNRQGGSVRATLFDASGAGGGQQRERGMAANLGRAVAGATDALSVVLVGNLHARTSRGAPWNSEYEPMGYVLSASIPAERLVSLNVGHGNGSAWICSQGCGVQQLGGRRGEKRWSIEIDEATRPAGYNGWYDVGSITASLPARMPAARPSDVPVQPGAGASPPRPQETPEPKGAAAEAKASPLSADETKLQGAWQAYDFASESKIWKFRFNGRRFRADGGTDDWYEGRIELNAESEPARMDFAIEDCRCSHKGMTSEGIFYWDEAALILAAPRPGSPRPGKFVRNSGQMMRLVRAAKD